MSSRRNFLSLLLGTLAERAWAQAIPWPGPGAKSAGAAVYAGPGDAMSFAGWYGLRAYTLAGIGGNVCIIRRSSDNSTKTFVSVAGGGINQSDAFLDGSNYFVTKLFDQTGTGRDISQTTAANQPQLLLSNVSGKPAMQFTATSNWFLVNTAPSPALPTTAQPFTFFAVAKCTNNGTYAPIFVTGGGVCQLSFSRTGSTTNTCFIYAGTAGASTAQTDGNWHSLSGLFSGGASKLAVDGATTTGLNPGSSVITTGDGIRLGYDTGDYLNGFATEAGFTLVDSSANFSAIYSNESTYYGGIF